MGPNEVQDVSLDAQDGVKWPQDGPKMRDTGTQMAQDGAKMGPRCGTWSKMEPRGGSWCQDGPKMRHSGPHLGARWSHQGGLERSNIVLWGGSLAARPQGCNGVVTGLFICGSSNGVVAPREGQQ